MENEAAEVITEEPRPLHPYRLPERRLKNRKTARESPAAKKPGCPRRRKNNIQKDRQAIRQAGHRGSLRQRPKLSRNIWARAIR